MTHDEIPDENRLIKERKEKLAALGELGVNPYPYSYSKTHDAKDLNEKYSGLEPEEKTEDTVSVAGRIMQLRRMGKATFCHIQDQSGRVQAYFRQDDIGKEVYKLLKKIDIGDIIGLKGKIFKTRTGEVSVYVSTYTLLTKTLRPLPEKYHGLQDPELRYRMRYVDLIMNPEIKDVFVKRTAIVNSVRNYLNSQKYLEVDTPVLQPVYGGGAAKPFKTHLNSLKMDVYLRIANELYLKRLMVGGFERVYEFSKDFRNEGIDKTHNPEFIQVEFYESYADYEKIMDHVENLYVQACEAVNGSTKIEYQGHQIDLKKPWPRLGMSEALLKYGGIDFEKLEDSAVKELLVSNRIVLEGGYSRGKALQNLFEELCEDKLIQPVFITKHPVESTPFCKLDRTDDKYIERFEAYIGGFEICNGYSELNDPILQRKYLEEQAGELAKGSAEAHPMDEDFIRAMEYGMPPAGGVGVGIDRMVMILTNQHSIRDVIFFPFMKV